MSATAIDTLYENWRQSGIENKNSDEARAFYEDAFRFVVAYANWKIYRPSYADDLAQEVLLEFDAKYDSNKNDSPHAYLCVLTVQLGRRWHRNNSKLPPSLEGFDTEQPDIQSVESLPDEESDPVDRCRQLSRDVLSAISQLPRKVQIILKLVWIAGVPQQRIAKQLRQSRFPTYKKVVDANRKLLETMTIWGYRFTFGVSDSELPKDAVLVRGVIFYVPSFDQRLTEQFPEKDL